MFELDAHTLDNTHTESKGCLLLEHVTNYASNWTHTHTPCFCFCLALMPNPSSSPLSVIV